MNFSASEIGDLWIPARESSYKVAFTTEGESGETLRARKEKWGERFVHLKLAPLSAVMLLPNKKRTK